MSMLYYTDCPDECALITDEAFDRHLEGKCHKHGRDEAGTRRRAPHERQSSSSSAVGRATKKTPRRHDSSPEPRYEPSDRNDPPASRSRHRDPSPGLQPASRHEGYGQPTFGSPYYDPLQGNPSIPRREGYGQPTFGSRHRSRPPSPETLPARRININEILDSDPNSPARQPPSSLPYSSAGMMPAPPSFAPAPPLHFLSDPLPRFDLPPLEFYRPTPTGDIQYTPRPGFGPPQQPTMPSGPAPSLLDIARAHDEQRNRDSGGLRKQAASRRLYQRKLASMSPEEEKEFREARRARDNRNRERKNREKQDK